MSRVFVAPSAGRTSRPGGNEDDAPWGQSSSAAAFRAYEPSEISNVRDTPLHRKPALERRVDPQRESAHGRHRQQDEVWQLQSSRARSTSSRALSGAGSRISQARSGASRASGASGASGASCSTIGPSVSQVNVETGPKPAWASVHARPIQSQPFTATTQFQRDQQAAAEGRLAHFPGRDEFAPRSKRMLMELALHRCSRESVASCSTVETESAFTVSTGASSGTMASRSSRHSSSAPTLASADSRHIEEGVAKRRAAAQLRAPAQWEADRQWVQDRWERDGPAGLQGANYMPSRADTRSFDKFGEAENQMEPIMAGIRDSEVRARK